MILSDDLWINKWSKEYYAPIVSDSEYALHGIIVGTDAEPSASICITSFINVMGDKYKEGMKILDYGCGSARVCNFLSKRLKDFHYIGLERFESDWGQTCIKRANELFGHDSRVEVGYTNTELDKKAIDTCETVLLLSVFTHTTIETTEIILIKLLPIVERGGNIVFSMIHGNEYRLVGNAYGFTDNFNVTYTTKEQVENLKNKLNVNIDFIDNYYSHSIYRVTKK